MGPELSPMLLGVSRMDPAKGTLRDGAGPDTQGAGDRGDPTALGMVTLLTPALTQSPGPTRWIPPPPWHKPPWKGFSQRWLSFGVNPGLPASHGHRGLRETGLGAAVQDVTEVRPCDDRVEGVRDTRLSLGWGVARSELQSHLGAPQVPKPFAAGWAPQGGERLCPVVVHHPVSLVPRHTCTHPHPASP